MTQDFHSTYTDRVKSDCDHLLFSSTTREMVEEPRVVNKEFQFTSSRGEREVLIVQEIVNVELGYFVWPCAHLLSQFIFERAAIFRGCSIVEVGSL